MCCEAGSLLMSYTWRDTCLMAHLSLPPILFQMMKGSSRKGPSASSSEAFYVHLKMG